MAIPSISNYLLRHAQVMLFSLGQLWRQPVASLMTILVIAIALSLPAGLYTLLKNIDNLSKRWDSANDVALFLHKNITDERAILLSHELKSWPNISHTTYQSAAQSLIEFQKMAGLNNLMDLLPHNPLPAVITVAPINKNISTDMINDLLARLEKLPEVEYAQLDIKWLQRLRSLSKVMHRGITILSVLLSLSVLLVIGNTIRLAILSRQSEIHVMKLVGATNAFIRLPFLYTGYWFGALGGLLAWLILFIIASLLKSPISELANLYGSQFTLQLFALPTLVVLIFSGITLGILGAWIAVGRHISIIDPD